MTKKADEYAASDPEFRNLIREYYEGLLLYEVSNREVWDKAAKDEVGLATYFSKNKKKYAWNEPRYKGIAYHVKDKADVKAVKNSIKKVPFDRWPEVLRATFNPDSVIRIRVEKGIFKRGDNALIDREVFKRDTTVTSLEDYPIDAVYGKILKKGPEDYTDVRGLVVADYQEELEREWVAALRRKFTFSVNKDVLKTVNTHHIYFHASHHEVTHDTKVPPFRPFIPALLPFGLSYGPRRFAASDRQTRVGAVSARGMFPVDSPRSFAPFDHQGIHC